MAFPKSKDIPEITPVTPFKLNDAQHGNVDAFLGKGSKVVGTLTFSGPVELDGHVEGEVVAQDKLVIGEAATINAKITGSDVLIRGTVNGDVMASKRLTLKRPAKVKGNLTTTNLSVEEGVVFEGKCIMNSQQSAAATSGASTSQSAGLAASSKPDATRP